jgi:peroxiredoxin
MKKSLLLIACLIVALGCSQEKPTAEEIAKKVHRKYDGRHSIAYDINYRHKYFHGDDTASIKGECIIVRDTADTVMNAALWINSDSDYEILYYNENSYSVYHNRKKISQYKCYKKRDFDGNATYELVRTYFIDTDKLAESIADTANTVFLSDTAIAEKDYWIFKIEYPDDGDFTDFKRRVLISKNDLTIEKIYFTAKFQGNYQYNEWNLSNTQFDKHEIADVKNKLDKKLALDYEYGTYDPKNYNRKPLLGPGEAAPDFTGERYSDGGEVSLSDYKGKVVVLDYWYMSCYPCVKAVPEINKLCRKFDGKDLVVLGLNPYDGDEKRRDKMPKFLEYNEFEYPIIFTDKEVPDSYNVTGYPAIFIIGRDGKIVHSHTGYFEDMHKDLDSVITAAL